MINLVFPFAIHPKARHPIGESSGPTVYSSSIIESLNFPQKVIELVKM
jgi:hypothetical protein